MTAVGQWRATYAPGDWLVLCGPTSVVVLEPPGAGWTSLAAELWEQVLAAASLTDLAARLAVYGLDTMPSFGALFWTGEGMRSLVRGAVRVVDPATGQVVADGDQVQTWSESRLATLTRARIETTTGDDPDALLLPLVVGAVRASSVVLDARPPSRLESPQLSGEPRPVDRPAARSAPEDRAEPVTGGDGAAGTAVAPTSRTEREAEQAGASALLPSALPGLPTTEALAAPSRPGSTLSGPTLDLPDGDEAPTEPQLGPAVPGSPPPPVPDGPTVLGVVCPHGHANPPGAERCGDCGVRVLESEPHPVPQPVLATLRVTDGTEMALDRLVRIGRAPVERGGVDARLLTVPSPSHDISRTHLEVAPVGWRVMVKDLNSTNGTVLVSPDGAHRRPLPAGEPVPVALGSVLELADGVSVLLDLPQ